MTKQKYNFNGRTEYIDKDVLKNAPTGGNVKDLSFFKLGKWITNEELEKEYASRGLTPATVEVLCAYDKENRAKMDEMKYVGTSWKDADGNWCYSAFGQWDDVERGVRVHRRGDCDWDRRWLFAGLASSSKPSDIDSSALLLDLAIKVVKKAGYQVVKII